MGCHPGFESPLEHLGGVGRIMSTATNDGFPVRCDLCGTSSIVNLSNPPGDSVCPACGTFLWVTALVEITRQNAFEPNLVIPRLRATTRDDAIGELTQAIAGELDWTADQQDWFVQAVLEREKLGSTGIGRGFAVPHAKVDWGDSCFSVMAYTPDGIPFKALDGGLVHTIVLVASPKSLPGEHLRLLERLSRAVRFL